MKKYAPLALIFIFLACDSNKVYEDFHDLEEAYWHEDDIHDFTFNIDDTTKKYNLKVHIRNSQAYPYHNLYYQYTLKNERDSVLKQEMEQMFLFDPKTGEPRGDGVGDLFDNTQTIMEDYTFPKAGPYKMQVQQYMRLDSLPLVLSVGFRVETVEKD